MEELQKELAEARARKQASQKKWYADNKERINNKSKQYYQDNKPRLKKESLLIKQCPLCRTPVRAGSLSHHKQTQKCKDLRQMREIYYTTKKDK